MSDSDIWTVRRLLEWTEGFLKQHGSDSPRLDAELLLASVRHGTRIELYTAYEETPDESQRAAFRQLVRRRADGEPVAYLLGHREFYSLEFQVTPDVLIPRPETEYVVITLLDLVDRHHDRSASLQVADIGTGSGILAICAARELEAAEVVAVDISPETLEVARSNAQRHGVADRITLLQSDLFASIAPQQQFDYIVSNPPYVSESEFAELDRTVRDHEPREALLAGAIGTDVITRLIPQAGQRLRAGGWLVIEISPMIEAAVYELLAADSHFGPPSTVKDLAQHARVISAQRV